MRSEKGWYWLAAGVLALGLNGAYQDGQLGWVHCLADRAAALVEQASERSLHLVTTSELMFGQSPETLGRTQAAFRKLQSKMAARQVAQAQRQIALAQARQQIAQAQLQRKMDLVQMKMDKVRMVGIDRAHDCSGFSKVVVNLGDMPKIDLSNLPDIDLSDVPGFDRNSVHGADGPI